MVAFGCHRMGQDRYKTYDGRLSSPAYHVARLSPPNLMHSISMTAAILIFVFFLCRLYLSS